MNIGIRKNGRVVVFLMAILLSACAERMPNDVLTGAISKPGGDLALLGTVEGISESVWTVDGRTIKLSDDTQLQRDLRIGDSVWVDVALGDDGFMNALVIEASSLDMFIVGTEFEFYGVVEEISSAVWLIAGFEVGVTPDTEIKAGIMVGDLVKVHANFGEEGDLIAREIESAEEDDENDGHDRDKIKFVGTVEAISDGEWLIDGRPILVTIDTEIEDQIEIGDVVKVEASEDDKGSLVADEIELADDDTDNDRDSENDEDIDDTDSDDDDMDDEDDDHYEDQHDEYDDDDESEDDHNEHDSDDD